MKRLVRLLTRWAWDDFLFDVGRVEWKYGREDDGTPKDWDEWNNVRDGSQAVRGGDGFSYCQRPA